MLFYGHTTRIQSLTSLISTPPFSFHIHVVLFFPISPRNKSTGTDIVYKISTVMFSFCLF